MNLPFLSGAQTRDRLQSRLLLMAGVFLTLYALVLTLSPAVRLHSWQVSYRWHHWAGWLVWMVGYIWLDRLSRRRLPERDPFLLPIAALLSGWGLLTVWRLDEDFGWRQTAWLAVGLLLVAFVIQRRIILPLLRKYKYVWLTGGLLLTVLTFFFGTYPGGEGPHLWLGCCGLYIQPSEPLKVLLAIYLAAYLADRTTMQQRALGLLLPTLILIGAALFILVTQRDLGTATIFIALYTAIVYLAYGKTRLLVTAALLLLAAAAAGYQLFGVIQVRVAGWLNPWLDPSGGSYQIVQSLIAVATGGTFGSGPGIGSPGVIPVSHSDFIFSAITEEMGLAGALGLILLLAVLCVRGLHTALHAPNQYQRFLAAGITLYLVGQSILIIGGNLRLLPLTGVTLPFVSYGGSSLATAFLGLGLLLLISSHSDEEVSLPANPRAFVVVGGIILAALAALALFAGYWGFIRGDDLQNRTDNPRWAITDRYVPRGRLLSNNNEPVVITEGEPGSYQRRLLYPAMATLIGYSHPLYGQAGLEASLDSYLRGLQGNPSSTIAYYHLIHDQTPPGLDVRLTIDLGLQQRADELLAGKAGAAVVLNARTGEILALSSHPGFDPASLEENWNEWIKDPGSVFLNRVSQGQYPPGAALEPFLLSAVLGQGSLPAVPAAGELEYQGKTWKCAASLPKNFTWSDLIRAGCPAAAVNLAYQLRPEQIGQLYHQFRLDQAPITQLPTAAASPVSAQDDPSSLAVGEGGTRVSPLQMALAAAALSNGGTVPAARIVSAVNTPQQGWVALPSEGAPSSPSFSGMDSAAQLLSGASDAVWQVTSTAFDTDAKTGAARRFTWHLEGSIPSWSGSPYTVVVLLEEENPAAAEQIGRALSTLLQNPN